MPMCGYHASGFFRNPASAPGWNLAATRLREIRAGSAVPRLPHEALAATPAVVIDTGNYYPSRDGRIEEIEAGLPDSQWVARVLGRPVIKAFNNIVAPSLAARGVPAGTPGRVCLSVAGDDPRSKKLVLGLIDALGFDGLDAGALADSWRQQPGTPAYCRDLAPPGTN